MSQVPVVDGQGVEREYLAHRREVLAMLGSEFRGLPDHEELYQEAWTEALELRARGQEIANLGGLLRTIAWRRARDQLRDWGAGARRPDERGVRLAVRLECPAR